jgi:SAM-dependent methyltransferase
MTKVNTPGFWDREFQKGYIYGTEPSESARKCVDFLRERGLSSTVTEILEIGGGYGRNARYLHQELGVPVTVVDFSQRAIQLGEEFCRGSVRFICGDAKSLLQVVNKQYPLVFYNFCLHLIPKAERMVVYGQVAEVLSPNGILVGSYLSVNDSDCPPRLRSDRGITKIVRGKPQHFFSQEEICSELDSKFADVQIEESFDRERIIDNVRNISYFFTVGRKK